MKNPQKKPNWPKATQKKSLLDNKTRTLVNPRQGKKTIRSKWKFKLMEIIVELMEI